MGQQCPQQRDILMSTIDAPPDRQRMHGAVSAVVLQALCNATCGAEYATRRHSCARARGRAFACRTRLRRACSPFIFK